MRQVCGRGVEDAEAKPPPMSRALCQRALQQTAQQGPGPPGCLLCCGAPGARPRPRLPGGAEACVPCAPSGPWCRGRPPRGCRGWMGTRILNMACGGGCSGWGSGICCRCVCVCESVCHGVRVFACVRVCVFSPIFGRGVENGLRRWVVGVPALPPRWCFLSFLFFLIRRSHSISFTRAQGVAN